MSAVLALLAARRDGARLFVRGDRLVVQSEGNLPAEVMASLRVHRDRLIDMLSLEPSRPPLCVPCGRPQHYPDVICSPAQCPSWRDPDPAWPIALPYIPADDCDLTEVAA